MAGYRRAVAEVDLGALGHNVALLRQLVAPAELCAVVKADGYGHGAVCVARAALLAGASGLAVAIVEEGIALREAGIEAPILLLSEPPADAFPAALAAALTPTIYTAHGLEAAAGAAATLGRVVAVQVKVDTGMHRVGLSVAELPAFVEALAARPELDFEALWTHFAVADDPADPFTGLQLARFAEARQALAQRGHLPRIVHAANSAGALAHPASRLDLVRCGIALYGYLPSEALALHVAQGSGGRAFRPVLSLRAEVHLVRELAPGERPSYGRRRALGEHRAVATVPLGYADGVPRRYFDTGGEVLIGGHRHLLAGAVTMDQLLVDVAPDEVRAGDEVVLIGRQGEEEITAAEWAARLGTLSYEILTGIGARVPRRFIGALGEAAVYHLAVHQDGSGHVRGGAGGDR